MRTEKIYVNGRHDYNLCVIQLQDVERYELKYTSDSEWAEPNKTVLVAEDYGDGISLEVGTSLELDYGQAQELHIVLSYIHKNEASSPKIEIRNNYTL